VTVAVTVVVIVVESSDSWSTLIFQGGRMGQGKGVVSSFSVGSKESGSWSFLQVGA
jgi:hypothetical protein